MKYYYVINTSEDYADEFDYPVVSSMTENERSLILGMYNSWKDGDFDEMYFGSNEFLSFYADNIRNMIENAEKLDETEYKQFTRFSTGASFDIVDRIQDTLYDKLGQSYDKITSMPFSEAKKSYPEYFI